VRDVLVFPEPRKPVMMVMGIIVRRVFGGAVVHDRLCVCPRCSASHKKQPFNSVGDSDSSQSISEP
jgi:hypothetical protein